MFDKVAPEKALDFVSRYLEFRDTDGSFVWKARYGCSHAKIGSIAGRKVTGGYIQIKIYGSPVGAHRLAFLLREGRWPSGLIDHINGVTSDNRRNNIRECTYAQNAMNKKVSKSNKTGFPGVCFRASTGKWLASIRVKGKRFHIGSFDSAGAAYQAYLQEKVMLHPNVNLERLPKADEERKR